MRYHPQDYALLIIRFVSVCHIGHSDLFQCGFESNPTRWHRNLGRSDESRLRTAFAILSFHLATRPWLLPNEPLPFTLN